MRQGLETLVALLMVLIALALLPNHEIPQPKKAKPMIEIRVGEITDVALKLNQWQGKWHSDKGAWIEDGGEKESAVFGLLMAMKQLSDLPKLDFDPKAMGEIVWHDGSEHHVLLSIPKFGDNVYMKIKDVWRVGDGEVMFKINELKKVSP